MYTSVHALHTQLPIIDAVYAWKRQENKEFCVWTWRSRLWYLDLGGFDWWWWCRCPFLLSISPSLPLETFVAVGLQATSFEVASR